MPPEINQEQDTLRDVLTAAVTESEKQGDNPADSQPAGEVTPPAGEVTSPAGEVTPPAGEVTPPAGEVTPPAGEVTPPAGEVTPPAVPPAGETPPDDPVSKAPGSWTPTAREHWKNTSPEIRREVWRREKEVSRVLTETTEARRLHSEFQQTMNPYMGFIAAEGSTPLKAVAQMMQTAAALRVGTAQQKVELVAGVIKQFGIDLHALDSVLAGARPEYDPGEAIQRQIQQAIAPFQQEAQQRRQREEQMLDQQIDSELTAFVNDPKHEFYADVKDVMADLIEVASRRGEALSLTAAYDRATLLSEPVRRVIEARKQQQATQQQHQAAQRARGAAVSVTPSSEVQQMRSGPGDSVRSAIEFAIANTGSR